MIQLRREQAPAGERPRCRSCEKIELRRQGRVGFLQKSVLSRFGYYPWECGLCREITFLRQRSVIAREQPATASAVQEPEHAVCAKTPAQPVQAVREPMLQAGIRAQPSVAVR